jgi:hypothetical protein
MTVDVGAPRNYLTRLARSTKPAILLVGGGDELFSPDRFAPLMNPAHPSMRVIIVPDAEHRAQPLGKPTPVIGQRNISCARMLPAKARRRLAMSDHKHVRVQLLPAHKWSASVERSQAGR